MRLLHSCRCFALALAAAVLAAGAARAAKDDEHKHDAKPGLFVKVGDKFRSATEAEVKAAAEHGHAEKGPLDFTGIKRYDLGIYTLIVFGLLMYVLAKFAWPKIREGLEKREVNIRTALDQAKQDQNAAAAIVTQAKKQMEEAAGQIKEMLDEARRDSDALRASERDAGAKDAQAERERAKREIEAAKDVALAEIYESSVDLATLLSAKTLSRQITADDHRRLLKESLDELKQAAKSA